MNTIKIMKNGHKSVLAVVKGLDGSLWKTPGACGEWSVKDILAHLASYEWMLVEALDDLIHEGAATPTLKRFGEGPAAFNDVEVGKRRDHSVGEVLDEYKEAHSEAMSLAENVPEDAWNRNGVLPWYGEAYDLDDFIVYTFYGHKREHCAQIAAFRDRHEE